MGHRCIATVVVAGLLATASLAAQRHRAWVELGAGTLGPDDPFAATLSLRASVGWMLSSRSGIGVKYSRQSANGSDGDDLGKFAHQFIGVVWQRGFTNAFDDQESMQHQYGVRIGGGMVIRGTFPAALGDERLKRAPFLDLGLVIRYPFTARVAAVGSIENAVAFLPRQTVRSYCSAQNGGSTCYPIGGPNYFTIDLAENVQHNLGIVAALQVRP